MQMDSAISVQAAVEPRCSMLVSYLADSRVDLFLDLDIKARLLALSLDSDRVPRSPLFEQATSF